ncbi:MAG: hypothetical protein HQL39_15940 [Alphaproteobacteria bacterium]|nr:hypothetical protein [Alphaproteobacteria bacterium]
MVPARKRELNAFYSIDISGSTAYKDRNANFSSFDKHWVRFYESFFQDFPSAFLAAVDRVAEGSGRKIKSPQLWKLLGDEILFYFEVMDFADVVSVTKAFYEALTTYDREIRGKQGLRAKGTAWLAGFPIRNSNINVENTVDFIGPDMDIGFRLSSASRAGRLCVSMDLADILASAMPEDNLDLHHVGWAKLKGVFDGHPYPVFWVTTGQVGKSVPWEEHECEFTARLLQPASEIAPRDAIKLVKSIRDELPRLRLFRPYLEQTGMPDFHRGIWTEWLEQQKRNSDYETGGADLGEETEAAPL